MEYLKMTLTKSEIKVLVEIYSGKQNITQIAKTLNLGFSSVSTTVSRLENKQLCKKIRHGKRIEIAMIETLQAQAFRKLIVQKKSFNVGHFLYGIRFRILSSCLYEEKTTEDIALMLDVPRKSIQNMIFPFVNRSILSRKKRMLIFNKTAWPLLFDFLNAYRNFSLIGDVLWKFENEIVFEVREKNETQGVLTGFSQYSQYGVPIMNVKYCCYIPKRKLACNDIFLHSLMQIGDETRLLNLAIVFFRKNKLKRVSLLRKAPKYDLKRKIHDFFFVLDSKKEKIITQMLPPTSSKDINEMMKLYHISD